MRVLVTNDDGVDAVGIQRMAIALADDDRFDVVVVAPDGDRSGAGASLGAIGPEGITGHRVELPDDSSVEAWALNASPAMCVMAATLGGFGAPPDIVVSGINAGLNTGRSVLHSGTVGAALTAQNLRRSALAVSLQSGDPWYWDTAAELAIDAIGMLCESPPRSVLNLNVPNRERSAVVGVQWARLAPFGEVRMAVETEESDPDPSGVPSRRLSTEFRLAEVAFEPDTDTGLVRAGYATLTALVGAAEAWPAEEQPAARFTISEQRTPGAPVRETHRVPDADIPGNLWRPIVAA